MKDSRFSKLPNRIIVPIEPTTRPATRAQLLASFAIALGLVAIATLGSYLLKGCK